MKVHRIPALNDNYIWLLHDEQRNEAVAVDPSQAEPVLAELGELGARLTAVWNTHHHPDHVGGNLGLAQAYRGLRIYGGAVDKDRIPGLTDPLRAGDTVSFAGEAATILDIPAHTRGHIAYVLGKHLFCGDTLFGGGCGRLFEGTPAMMRSALAQLRELPDDTLVHAGHEYTWHNVKWASETGIEPGNAALQARHARLVADTTQRTMPTSMAEEKAANPFLRWDVPEVMAWTGQTAADEVFAVLRQRKDVWRP